MSSKKQSFFSIGLLLTSTALLGKVLGFLRGVLISYYYGATAQTDAFFLAIAIPTTLLGVFTYSADSAIIPQYRRLSNEKGRGIADRNFSTIVNMLTIIGVFVTVILVLFPSIIISFFAPDFNTVQSEYAAEFLRFFCTCGLMHIITCFFSAYCTIYQRVKVRSILSFASNLVVVISLLIWADPKMYFLSIAFVASSLIGAISQIVVAHQTGYQHLFIVDIKRPEFKEFIIIFLPIMGTALLNDIRILVGKIIASGMEIGTISYLDYANKFTALFDSMIVVGIGVAIIPMFANYSVANDFKKFKDNASSMTLVVTLMLLPVTIVMMVFSKEIIYIVYGRGSFDESAIDKVAQALLYSAPIITLSPLNALLSRILYAKEDTKRPLIVSAISIGANIVLSYILSKYIGMIGIPLGTSIAGLINLLLLIIVMSRIIGWSKERFGISHVIKLSVGIILTALLSSSVKSFGLNIYLTFILGALISFAVYIVLLMIIFRSETKMAISLITKRLKKEKQG